MPPTTVEPKASLDSQQRDWLKQMAAALQVKLDGAAPQAAGAAPLTATPMREAKGPAPSSTATAAPPTTTAAPPTPTSTPTASPPPPGRSAPVEAKTPAKTAPKTPEQEAYEKERDEVKKLVDALNKHAHKAHIARELTSITTELGKAKIASKANKYADAMKALEKAKEAAGKAKEFADKYEAYAKKRATAQYMVRSFKDLIESDYRAQTAEITAADNLAKTPTRNYTGATTKIETVISTVDVKLNANFTRWFITPNTPTINALKSGAQKDFLKVSIKAIEDQMTVLNANIAAKEYNKCYPSGWKLEGLIRSAEAVATNRTKFDTQRVTTVAAVDALKPFKALSTQMDDLNKRLKEADDQASVGTREFNSAVEALKKIEADAKGLTTNGPAAESYSKDRPVADKAYEDLAKHKQAAAQKPLLDGIKIKLDKAAELAKDLAKVSAANAELKFAKQEIDATTKVLNEADAIGVVAGNASDAATGKTSLEALKVSLAAAKRHKHANDFSNEFKAIDAKVESTDKKLKDANKVQEAIKEIKSVGDDLSKVMIQLTQHEGYAAERAALENRLKNVKALPEAPAIQANIAPLEAALNDADTHDKAHAFDKRAEAMVKARETADLAEKTAEQSKTYKTRQDSLENTVAGSTLGRAEKKAVTDLIKPAAKEAAALHYDEATKLLNKAEAEYETQLINGFAKKSPVERANIEAAAKRMIKSGSVKELDKLIQKLPNSTQLEVLQILAKERFGIELKSDARFPTPTAKAMLNMMAKVPDHVVNNSSLKTVERRRDPDNPDGGGGYYQSDERLVVMHGRRGQDQQAFGTDLVGQLPRDIDPECKPRTRGAVNFFDFTMLHELGHSVDDNLQFMATKGRDADKGKWETYGGNNDPIVDAVAAKYKYDSTPEQKKAISDLIDGNQVTWPTPPAGTPADKVKEWKDGQTAVKNWYKLATFDGIWENQSKASKININGRVYHRAYEGRWVSYDFDARKKGLTGYQFRAPGEWFAELYAAYRMDKLKPEHPAVAWLSKLKI